VKGKGAKPSIVIGDAEYLKALSGYKQKTAVARWCTKSRIKFFRNSQGWPVTTPAALDRALFGGADSGPDWGYFDDKTIAARPTCRQKEMDSGLATSQMTDQGK
jgi:hypothetical protein